MVELEEDEELEWAEDREELPTLILKGVRRRTALSSDLSMLLPRVGGVERLSVDLDRAEPDLWRIAPSSGGVLGLGGLAREEPLCRPPEEGRPVNNWVPLT